MKAFRSVTLLAAVLLATFFSSISGAALAPRPPIQEAGNITGDGQFCDDQIGFCGEFHLTFNPLGGPVTGSFSSRHVEEDIGEILTVTGSLTGIFTGGDGGVVSGTIVSGTWHWTCPTCDFILATPASLAGRAWNGHLYANGTGTGLLMEGVPWNVTFPAEEFQAGLILPTPTKIAVQAVTIQLDSTARDVIASSLPLNEATNDILGQDAVLIARDANNGFYAVNNNGQSVPLPDELKSVFKLSDRFAILESRHLLDSFALTPQSDAINGGSGYPTLEKMPSDLKDRDYLKVFTSCTEDAPQQCNSVMQVNTPAASIRTCTLKSGGPAAQPVVWPAPASDGAGNPMLSSEHGCIRGTINGGGDFIDLPLPTGARSAMIGYSTGFRRQDANGSYLGVIAEMRDDGALVQQVQAGSPADLAGLKAGDVILEAAGQRLNKANSLEKAIADLKGGEPVELAVLRNGESQSITAMLAQIGNPVILTPSAEITVPAGSVLAVDVGFNGYTGVLVLNGLAVVREPLSGSRANLVEGQAVIVASGSEIGAPVSVGAEEVNAWWEESGSITGLQPEDNPPLSAETPDSQTTNPLPVTSPSLPWWLILVAAGGCCGGVALLLLLIIILIIRRKRR